MTLLPSFIIDLIKSIVYVHIHVYATVHIYHSFTEKAKIVFLKMGFAQYLSRMLGTLYSGIKHISKKWQQWQ